MRTLGHVTIILTLVAGAAPSMSQPPPPTTRDQLTAADERLLSGAMEAEMEIVREALKNGANPNATEEDGVNALMLAAGVGEAKIVELLLESGANAKATDEDQRSALHHAVDGQASNADIDDPEYQEGFRTCVKLLINAGIDVNWKDRDGFTALSITADDTIRSLLVKAGGRQ